MSKKSRRSARRQVLAPAPKSRKVTRRAGVVALCALLALTAAGGALSRWGGARVATLTGGFLQATPTPTPLTLSKEYVYAGGRLVATEEPAAHCPTAKACVPKHTLDGSTPPQGLVATARLSPQNQQQIVVTWNAAAGLTVDHYEVERSQSFPGGFAVLTPTGPGTSFTDPTATPGVAYLYRVRAFDADGGYTDYSNLDLATDILFTDDPLIGANDPQGRPATAVYARHLTELHTAVDAVRALVGRPPSAWKSDPSPATGGLILAAHLLELRTNLNPALSDLGLAQLPNDSTLAIGLPVKASHVQDVRNIVK